MKFVISIKNGKSYSLEVNQENAVSLYGKKIKNEIDLTDFGLQGYIAVITGGSDKEGFPMRYDFESTSRKKVLLSKKPCFKPEVKGERKRISVRGNTISDQTQQVNLKVIKEGSKSLAEILGKEEKKQEDISFKEKAIKQSLENVGTVDAEEAKKLKVKSRK